MYECDEGTSKQRWIFYECTIRPQRDTDLCMTVIDPDTRPHSDCHLCDWGGIFLKTCKSSRDDVQKFRFFDPDGDRDEKFRIKLLKKGYEHICLTSQHHPSNEEDLQMFTCKTAEENDPGVNDDTSYWIVGRFHEESSSSSSDD